MWIFRRRTSISKIPFISTWDTTGTDGNITIRLQGPFNVKISSNEAVEQGFRNNGDSPQTITINVGVGTNQPLNIVGKLPAFLPLNDSVNRMTNVTQWGCLEFTGKTHLSSNKLTTITANDMPLAITDLTYAFANCTNLVSINRLNEWNISQCIHLDNVFYACNKFNQDIGNWDTSAVESMSSAFQSANVFNQDLSRWNVSRVTNMASTFKFAHLFASDVSTWDLSNVALLYQTFRATNVNSDLSNIPIKAHDISGFFYDSKMNFPLQQWDWSAITNINYLFISAFFFDQDVLGLDWSNITSANSLFEHPTKCFSPVNYGKLLQQLDNHPNIPADTLDSSHTYDAAYESYRTNLINKGWTIIDNGVEA